MMLEDWNANVAAITIILTMPGLIINICCSTHFYKRMFDSGGRVLIPYLIAFSQTSLDCSIALALIISNLGFFLIFSSGTSLRPVYCLLTRGCLFDLCLGMRAVTNLVIAVFNYIKLLYPFTTSPLPFKKLVLAISLSTLAISSLPIIRDITQLKPGNTKGCVSLDVRITKEHALLVLGHLSYLYIFIYLYLLPACGIVYLYKITMSTLIKGQGEERNGDETESNMERNVVHLVLIELEKTLMLDGYMMIIFFAPVFAGDFYTKYFRAAFGGNSDIDLHRTQISRIIASMYSTFYVFFSLAHRRVYRGAAGELTLFLSC